MKLELILKKAQGFWEIYNTKTAEKSMFSEKDSSITNLLCLILAQVLCFHFLHQQHAIHSSETTLTRHNFTDLSAGLSGDLVEFLVLASSSAFLLMPRLAHKTT